MCRQGDPPRNLVAERINDGLALRRDEAMEFCQGIAGVLVGRQDFSALAD
jgi:hypothetical protein